MRYPKLSEQSTSQQMVDTFRGYNHNLRIGDGEFYDMKNLTSDSYPVLSPRGRRTVYAAPENPQGMIGKDSLCYVDGSEFVMDEYRVEMGLSREADMCPKQLVSMGAYVIILPDRKYINTMDLTDFGNLDAKVQTQGNVSISLCRIDGSAWQTQYIQPTAPVDPADGEVWIDTSTTPHALKQWAGSSGMWVGIASTYVRIAAPGIGAPFGQYDGITISGLTASGQLGDLNGSNVIWEKGDDYIVVVGILDMAQTVEDSITVERTMPKVDFVTESGNRLWGCRYGVAENGEVVNEIYASKLGDFKNWNCFMGLSTDSYAASCGTDGPFTGAITHLGYPLFFKENCLHKVYGNYPANFQIQDTACRGVQKGCDKSLAIVNEILYYKARSGICAYDGSLPAEASQKLGNAVYGQAAGGAVGNKYYICMEDSAGAWNLFVYDTAKGLWMKEDDLHASAFCACRGELYCMDANTGKILALLGSGEPEEEAVAWMAQTGELGLSSPDMKYVSRLTVRLSMEVGAKAQFSVQYDLSDQWEPVCRLTGTSLRSFSVPIRPRRCDHLRLRIEGTGMAKIYSITKTIEQGSEIS